MSTPASSISDANLVAVTDVVRTASGIARRVQRELTAAGRLTKDDRSPVTVADYAVQAVVALGLQEATGNDARIVGEEHAGDLERPENAAILGLVVEAVRHAHPSISSGSVLQAIAHCNHDGTSESYWALDPIDGTKGFLRGQQYAIALGHIERGLVTAGIMGCPNMPADHSCDLETADELGCMFWAVRGQGAFEQSGTASPRRICAATALVGGTMRVCESVESSHSKQDDTRRILQTMGHANAAPVRLDSQAKYAVVARGQADAYLRLPTKKGYVEKIWDHAAGMLIAQEGGAIVTDIAGRPLDFGHGRLLSRNSGIVCSTPHVHGRIIQVIADLGIAAAPAGV